MYDIGLSQSLDLDRKLLQVLVVLNVGCNSITNDLCALFAVLLCPFSKELLVALRRFLLLEC